jgi:DeoR family fructose operon transcriptional repressor
MFLEERHQKIIEMLNNKKRLEVRELSKHFEISEDSIRRDLRIMEDKGLVKRTYGGIILPDKVGNTTSILDRENINPEKKEEIAETASLFIKENDTILLDGSSTTEKLIPHLIKFKKLILITNSIPIAFTFLYTKNNIKLIFLGGEVNKEIGNSFSFETYKMIRSLNVDKVFMGVCAISPKLGMSVPIINEGHIKKAMIKSAREAYFLVDSEKFGTRLLYNIGQIKPEYTIITDSKIKEETLKNYENLIKKGLKIVYKK